MAYTKLHWWRCKFCGASISYTHHEDEPKVIAAHFQRCAAIHQELVAMFLRMASPKPPTK